MHFNILQSILLCISADFVRQGQFPKTPTVITSFIFLFIFICKRIFL